MCGRRRKARPSCPSTESEAPYQTAPSDGAGEGGGGEGGWRRMPRSTRRARCARPRPTARRVRPHPLPRVRAAMARAPRRVPPAPTRVAPPRHASPPRPPDVRDVRVPWQVRARLARSSRRRPRRLRARVRRPRELARWLDAGDALAHVEGRPVVRADARRLCRTRPSPSAAPTSSSASSAPPRDRDEDATREGAKNNADGGGHPRSSAADARATATRGRARPRRRRRTTARRVASCGTPCARYPP